MSTFLSREEVIREIAAALEAADGEDLLAAYRRHLGKPIRAEDDSQPGDRYEVSPTPNYADEMSEWELRTDDQSDVRFRGRKLCEVSNRWRHGREETRWVELTLYQTLGGFFVIQRADMSLWQAESSSYSVALATSHAEIVEHLGQGLLAKELYQKANIENVRIVP